ncbi:hypothetical protein O4U47_12290 [Nocardiopsis sp. LSu2-4]|uniref:Uncharacterized protein n=1 Tax=Nocardiopsis suaedae TaxID=3018444 RepID=A0ABT4TKQ2_9ACTN|nr:hypothetical protein [Nocardiopsis suaedae]MDA2805292.1 hypothetical protein [Nocardiopsis suaedae]
MPNRAVTVSGRTRIPARLPVIASAIGRMRSTAASKDSESRSTCAWSPPAAGIRSPGSGATSTRTVPPPTGTSG